jgi:peptidoglycan/LPS O-acetylase OafA/YrhL
MGRTAALDPGPTGLPGDLPNLHNRPGDLAHNLCLTAGELLMAVALLRPWSYDRSWGRAIATVALFLPWTFLNVAFLIHSGGIMATHAVFLVVVLLSAVVLTAVSGIAAARRRRTTSVEPAT